MSIFCSYISMLDRLYMEYLSVVALINQCVTLEQRFSSLQLTNYKAFTMIKDLFEQLKKKVDISSHDPLSTEDTNSPITKLTTDKLKAIVADLTNAGPIFKEAGFVMEQLEVEVGLLPKIVPQFHQINKIPKEDEDAVLQQLNDRKLLQFVLQSLFKSSRMEALLGSTDLGLHAIEIEISAPPSVRTIFKRKPAESEESKLKNDVTTTDQITRH